METNVLTTEEAAKMLNVSPRTIRRMIERGSIDAHKMDPNRKSVYQIPLSEVQRLLGERKNQRSKPGRK